MHLSDMSLSVTIGLPIQVCNLYSMITSENVRVHPTQQNNQYLKTKIGKCQCYHTEDQKQSAVTKARNDSIQEHHTFESRLVACDIF